MDFGGALAALKDGKLVARQGWPGGCFLYLVPGSEFAVNRHPLLGIFPEGKKIQYSSHIDIHRPEHTDDGTGDCAVWTAAQGDLLAEDWLVSTAI